jgi:hypothetical protein
MNINQVLDANLHIARVCSNSPTIAVRPIRVCGGCGGDAEVLVDGYFPRCQVCANKIVNYWSEMRAAKTAAGE